MGQLLYDKASLVNIPSRYKDGKLYNIKPSNADFEFERGTQATRVNEDGLIEYVGIGEELATSTNWTNGAVYDSNTETLTATNLTTNTSIPVDIENNETYLITYTINSITSAGAGVRTLLGGSNGSQQAYRNESGTYSEIVTYPSAASIDNLYFSVNGTTSFEITDISLKQISNDTPRIDYTDPNNPSLLLEPERTNLIANANSYSGNTVYYTVTPNQASPDGENNATLFTEKTNTASHIINSNGAAISGGQTYTYSFFIKYAGKQNIPVNASDGLSGFAANIDILNGVVNSGTAEIQEFEDGWYRVSMTRTAGSGATNATIQMNFGVITGDGTSGFYLFGYQVEQGSYATSYIPTNGGIETRNADICIGGGDADTFNDSEGTLYLEYEPEKDLQMVALSDGTSGEAIWIYLINGGANLSIYVNSGGGQVASINCGTYESITANSNVIKVAATYKTNEFKAFVNGSLIATDTSGAAPTGLNTIEFKYPTSSAYNTKAKIKALTYFPEVLEDHELERLTSPTPLHASSFEDLANNNGYTIL